MVRRLPPPLIAAACLASGAALCLRGLSPAGSRGADLALLVVGGSFGTLMAAMSPWWAMAAAGAIAAVAAEGAVGLVVGLVALTCAVARASRLASRPVLALVGGACTVQGAAWLGRGQWFGASSVLGLGMIAVLVVVPVAGWSTRARRRVVAGLGAALAASMFALIGLAAASASAKPSFIDANTTLQQAFGELAAGDAVAAAQRFDAASQVFRRIARELDQPWSRPSQLIPVVSQHTGGIAQLSAGAAEVCHDLSVALEQIDPAALRFTGGRLDLDALGRLDQPLDDVERSLQRFAALVDDVRSPWLVDLVQDALADADRELTRSLDAVANLRSVLGILPAALGTGEPRRYFVAFVTPAEARGLGGFMGNYAELTATDGTVEMTRFGRTIDLRAEAQFDGVRLDVSDEFVARYGDFGFAEPTDLHVSPDIWSNVTMSPDLPTTAKVIAELYRHSGGSAIDGVLVVDPSAMAALVELTGPVRLPGREDPLAGGDVEAYILRDQYTVADKAERVDALEILAKTVVERLLGGDLPGPWKLARLMGPVLARGGLAMWSGDPAEQAVFEQVGVSAELPALAGSDGLSVVVNNAAANKIDAHLRTSVRYDVSLDPSNHVYGGVATIELANDAPATGLASYVIGNSTGDPVGTNRMYVSVYSGTKAFSAMLDDTPLAMERGTELGWHTSSTFVTVPPGGRRTLTIRFVGELTSAGYSWRWRPQPMAIATDVELDVRSIDGRRLVHWHEPQARRDKVLTVS